MDPHTMEILIAGLTALLANSFVVAISTVHFRRLFLAEKTVHVAIEGGQERVIAGPRRKPLAVAAAERQVVAARSLAARSGWLWPLSYWRLYGPKRSSDSTDELTAMRQKAVDSQRNALLVEALTKGQDGNSIVALIMDASTDAGFTILRDRLAKLQPPVFGQDPEHLKLSPQEIATIVPPKQELEEIVLIEVRGGSKRKALAAPRNSPFANLIPSSEGESARAANAREAAELGMVEQPNGIPLPADYSWSFKTKDKGASYEKMEVMLLHSLQGKRDQVISTNEFYSTVYKTPVEQAAQIREIQNALRNNLTNELDPTGLSAELRDHLGVAS